VAINSTAFTEPLSSLSKSLDTLRISAKQNEKLPSPKNNILPPYFGSYCTR
jgi:hypothetical protein